MKKKGTDVHRCSRVAGSGGKPGNTGQAPGIAGYFGKAKVDRSKPAAARPLCRDVFTKAKRSAVMARIRGSGNKATELRLMAILRVHRLTGWRRDSTLPGRPDFVFPGEKLAVFVDGCFWHGCPLHATWPKNNAAFWRKKLRANRRRDREVNRVLRRAGWRVLRIWEHALTRARTVRTAARLRRALGYGRS